MKFTAYDGAQHRTERLQKTLRIALAIMGMTAQQADVLISELDDDRGVLTVYWNHPPSAQQRAAFATAWGECGESPDRVEHGNS